MSNFNSRVDAATSTARDRDSKDAILTRTNPIINFQLGLIAALLCVYLIVELSTPVRETIYQPRTTTLIPEAPPIGEFDIIPNEPPKQKVIAKAPKTPKQNKPVTKDATPVITDNEDPIVKEPESSDTSPEPDVDTPVDGTSSEPDTNKLVANNPARPLVTVSEAPLYPGCNTRLDRKDRIDCLNNKMARYIQKRFDTGLADNIGVDQFISITVLFTIGTDGLPKDLLIKAPNKKLEEEARDVIMRLPQMTPGKIDGIPVDVRYALPIKLQVL